jgi:hypothetical protein
MRLPSSRQATTTDRRGLVPRPSDKVDVGWLQLRRRAAGVGTDRTERLKPAASGPLDRGRADPSWVPRVSATPSVAIHGLPARSSIKLSEQEVGDTSDLPNPAKEVNGCCGSSHTMKICQRKPSRRCRCRARAARSRGRTCCPRPDRPRSLLPGWPRPPRGC